MDYYRLLQIQARAAKAQPHMFANSAPWVVELYAIFSLSQPKRAALAAREWDGFPRMRALLPGG